MASTAPGEGLFSHITIEEKKNIPENVSKKLVEAWSNKLTEINSLKIEIEKCKTSSDQEKFRLERDLTTLHKDKDAEVETKSEVSKRLKEAEEKISKLEEELRLANNNYNSVKQELNKIQNEVEGKTSQSEALAGSLESRSRQMIELEQQVESLKEQLTKSTHDRCDAILKAEEATSKDTQFAFKEKMLHQEKDMLARQLEVSQKQLEQRITEAGEARREHSTNLLGIQSELNDKIEECRRLKEETEHKQKQIEEKTERIEELLAALKESRESEAKLDETFRQELAAQKKLADIYLSSSEDQKAKCADLENGAQELRKLLQEASEQYGALEAAKERAEEESAEAHANNGETIRELKEELEKVNLMLEASTKKDASALAELSPAASSASQLMSRGLSLSQLYAEYLSVSEKLLSAEEENKRLKRYVDQILQEIEERAPTLRKQRDDYEKSLDTINNLHAQMDQMLTDLDKQKAEADEHKRRSDYLTRENDRQVKEIKDLGRQVTILLTQVEAARSGRPAPPIPEDIGSSPGGGRTSRSLSSGDLITQRLVGFRDVAELQEQNQRLLASIRELSKKIEETEDAAVEAKTQHLKEELDLAQTELEELQAQRKRQDVQLDNVTRQRDMYRILLQQQSPKGKQVPQHSKSPGAANVEVRKLREELEAMQKEMGTQKKEQEDYRAEKQKNIKMMENEYSSLRSNLEKTRNNNIKLLSAAEYNDERIKTLSSNCETYQRQIYGLEEKNNTLQGIIGRHEGTIDALRSECMIVQKKLSHAEVIAANLREEKTLLKETEARMMAEREASQYTSQSTSMVLANLEAIKNNLERSESQSRMRYDNQIADLTAQNSRLKAKLDSNSDGSDSQTKLIECEARLRNLEKEHTQTNKQLLDARTELAVSKNQVKQLKENLQKSPQSSPLQRTRAGGAGAPGGFGNVRELQVQLSEEKAKVQALTSSLDVTRKNLNGLKTLSEQQEKNLKDSSQAQKLAQDELARLRKERETLTSELKQSQDELKSIGDTASAMEKDQQSQLNKLREELEAMNKKAQDASQAMKEAQEEKDRAKRDADEKIQSASEAQEKYEREVMLHGADLKALAALKEKLGNHSSELQQITSAKLKAEEALRDTRLGFEERENLLRTENKNLVTRTNELEEQNRSLLDQFTQLSDKLGNIQSKLAAPSGDDTNTSASFTEDEARTSDQLREILKYLRRERDVASSKQEVSEAEVQRLQAQKDVLEKQVESLKNSLAQEQEKTQTSLDTAGKYGELMRKVHTYDALADSNRVLREEKDSLKLKVDEAVARQESLEKQMQPLQEKMREHVNRIETLIVDKKSLNTEKEMYKKRTQELVEKLNRAKPEDFVKLQLEMSQKDKLVQSKDMEINKIKNQIQQLQKNQSAVVNQKLRVESQLASVRDEYRKSTANLLNSNAERNGLSQQLNKANERIRILESSSQEAQTSHQAEIKKINETRNQERNQEKMNMNEIRQREELLKKEVETVRKNITEKENKLKELQQSILELQKKNENLEKQGLQLRKIATKYKKQAVESEGSEESSISGAPAEKVKELEDNIAQLKQQLEQKTEEAEKTKTDLEHLRNSSSRDGDLGKQMTNKDNEIRSLKNQLEANSKELENVRKSKGGEEMEKLAHDLEMANKKLQMAQRQLEWHKQTPGTSKPAASGTAADKISEAPPTANIKPMAAPVAAAVASPRLQVSATQVVAPSRPIPTASIRPMAPPMGGAAGSSSSVMVVSPLETHSDGMVSSTVTLPQATVTPTPAVSASTHLTTSTSTTATTTLTATVSPTPAALTAPQQQTPTTSQSGEQAQTGSSNSLFAPASSSSSTATAGPSSGGSVSKQPFSEGSGASQADALISQAIAMASQQDPARAGTSGITGSQKRPLESSEVDVDEKRMRTSGAASSTKASSGDSDDKEEEEDVILVDSEEDAGGSQQREDDDGDDEDDEDDEENVEEEEDVNVGDEDEDDDDDDDMEGDDSSQGYDGAGSGEDRDRDRDGGAGEAQAAPREGQSGHMRGGPGHLQRQQSTGFGLASSTGGPRSPLVPSVGPGGRQIGRGGQALAPFSSLPQYEEGPAADDSIVPSTPTLFAPRRGDGFAEAVSSPQVPSAGFVFGANPELSANPPQTSGLAQMAEGGLIDDTRMDLSQLEQDSNRSQPSTPVHRSPTADVSESGVSTTRSATGRGDPPAITVTQAEPSTDGGESQEEGSFSEADSMAAEGQQSGQDDVVDIEGGDEGEAGEGEDSSGPMGAASSPSSSSSPQRRITPITWGGTEAPSSPQRAQITRGRGMVPTRFGSRGFGSSRVFGSTPTPAGGMMRAASPPAVRNTTPAAVRGTMQRARRSRPGHFGARGSPS